MTIHSASAASAPTLQERRTQSNRSALTATTAMYTHTSHAATITEQKKTLRLTDRRGFAQKMSPPTIATIVAAKIEGDGMSELKAVLCPLSA
ncbi:MAG: hypothetical protein V4773_13810 [Verrucomicrobiota bacterium]